MSLRPSLPPQNPIAYRSDIDGLRAIAVLSVIAFHLAPRRLSGGFVGVDVFFVISGFLISSILYRELEHDKFSLVEFYVRRIRRIYPALFLVLLAVSIACWFILLPNSFVEAGQQIFGGSTFIANFVLWSQSGYFSVEALLKPLLHLWSLGVEEQYYLIFPLLCMAFYRSRSRWTLPAIFGVVTILSMALNLLYVKRYTSATYYLPYSRLWELFLGALLALNLQRNLLPAWEKVILSRWRHAFGILGFLLILVSSFKISEQNYYPGWLAIFPTMGAVFIIAAGPASWINRKLLSWKPLVFIGLISYPLYLWHWPILSFMRVLSVEWGMEVSRSQKFILPISLTFLLAWLTYRFVEIPVRKVKEPRLRFRGALVMLTGVLLIGAFGGLVILKKGFPSRFAPSMIALDHDFTNTKYLSGWRYGTCHMGIDQSGDAVLPSCVDPAVPGESRPLVVIWGDSHAADLFPGFRYIQNKSNIRLAQFTAAICPPILGLELHSRPFCRSINDKAISRIQEIHPDVVVLSAYWNKFDTDITPATQFRMLRQTISTLEASGVKKVVVLGSAPNWDTSVPNLLRSELHRHPNSPLPQRLPTRHLYPQTDTLLQQAISQTAAIYIPISDQLCDSSTCLVTTGPGWQDFLFFDADHFTQHGAELIIEKIWPLIAPATM